MPLDPRLWLVPVHLRRFPDDVAEAYMDENTPLVDAMELWEWKYDLVNHTPHGPQPDYNKMAVRLGNEVDTYMRLLEPAQVEEQEPLPPGPYENRRERSLLLALKEAAKA